MSEARIELFKKMLETEPQNTPVRFGLANELMKAELWTEAIEQLRVYLSQADDQGAAYGKLAQALDRIGRGEEARAAYTDGIATATRHGHPGLAQEFELALTEML
ncbi:MAG: tetratricopeptide repeat protein [Acidobacteriota bacterium]